MFSDELFDFERLNVQRPTNFSIVAIQIIFKMFSKYISKVWIAYYYTISCSSCRKVIHKYKKLSCSYSKTIKLFNSSCVLYCKLFAIPHWQLMINCCSIICNIDLSFRAVIPENERDRWLWRHASKNKNFIPPETLFSFIKITKIYDLVSKLMVLYKVF